MLYYQEWQIDHLPYKVPDLTLQTNSSLRLISISTRTDRDMGGCWENHHTAPAGKTLQDLTLKLADKNHFKPHLLHCNGCHRQWLVPIGRKPDVFTRSHPQWLQTASKTQKRPLDVQYYFTILLYINIDDAPRRSILLCNNIHVPPRWYIAQYYPQTTQFF